MKLTRETTSDGVFRILGGHGAVSKVKFDRNWVRGAALNLHCGA
jgi:hypothetical protein